MNANELSGLDKNQILNYVYGLFDSKQEENYGNNGWIKGVNGKFKYEKNGKYLTGWQKLNNQWYYFDPVNAWALTGLKEINHHFYDFDFKDGHALTGYQIVRIPYKDGTLSMGDTFFDLSNAYAVSGWQKVGNVWRYFKPSMTEKDWERLSSTGNIHDDLECDPIYKKFHVICPRMVRSAVEKLSDGNYYDFYYDGHYDINLTGWFDPRTPLSCDYYGNQIKTLFYLKPDASPITELTNPEGKVINGKRYFFNSMGEMINNNIYYDHNKKQYYVLDANGQIVKVKQPRWYYLDSHNAVYIQADGTLLGTVNSEKWLTIDGIKYLFHGPFTYIN